MKKFVVALISFFDNDIKQFKIEAKTSYDAVNMALIDICDTEESKKYQIEWINSFSYPKTIDELKFYIINFEMDFCVTEVKEF